MAEHHVRPDLAKLTSLKASSSFSFVRFCGSAARVHFDHARLSHIVANGRCLWVVSETHLLICARLPAGLDPEASLGVFGAIISSSK